MNSSKTMVKIYLPLLLILVGFPQISETIYTPALPAVAAALGASAHAVESTLAIYFVGFAVGVLIWGVFSDHVGRRKAMLLGLLLYSVSCVGCGSSQTLTSLLFWRFMQAVGASVGSVVTQTMMRDLYVGKERSQIFSIISASLAFSPAVGPLLGGFLSEYGGWRSNFWALVVLGVVLSLISLFKLPETRPIGFQPPSFSQIRSRAARMIRSRWIWGHVLLVGASNGIIFSFYAEAPFIFIEQLGVRPTHYGLVGILIASATLVAARISFLLSGRVDPRRVIQGGALLTLIGGLTFTATRVAGMIQLSPLGIGLILAALALLMIGIGLVVPNSLSIALKDHQDMVGTAGSFFGALYYVLIAALTWGMSLLHNGTSWPLPLYLLFLGVLLLVGSRVIKREPVEELYNV